VKQLQNKKVYFFVDESGDTVFFNNKGEDLVKAGKASSVFIVGYFEADDFNDIHKRLTRVRDEIKNDSYLQPIPSLKKSLIHFHAKDDCPEVREKVFKEIIQMNIKCYAVVARKSSEQFKKKFNGKAPRLYEYLVEKLFENRLHLYSKIDIYFSKMGNVIREENMKMALDTAKDSFEQKWGHINDNTIRLFIQEPSQITPLQVVDYILWSINRVYEKGDMRYFNFVKEKVELVLDIFDNSKYPGNYYTSKNPLDINKISPFNS